MEELTECPLCSGRDFHPFLVCKDHTVSKENFSILSCTKCSFKFTNPRPDAISIGSYYESEDYISHSNTSKGLINKLYQLVKTFAIQNKIKLIENLKPKNKTILDIGCGTGSFLKEIQSKNWNAKGVEPSDKVRRVALNSNLKIFSDTQTHELKENEFSIITMWHVLEHVHELKKRIHELYKFLEEGGYAIIAVPNPTSWDAIHYKEFWAAYDVPRHLYHFSPENIKRLFIENKFIHVKSVPMKMDAYYVCMLSEKYLQSSFQLLKSLIKGFISNLKTKNDAEKYSSVIYIFKK